MSNSKTSNQGDKRPRQGTYVRALSEIDGITGIVVSSDSLRNNEDLKLVLIEVTQETDANEDKKYLLDASLRGESPSVGVSAFMDGELIAEHDVETLCQKSNILAEEGFLPQKDEQDE